MQPRPVVFYMRKKKILQCMFHISILKMLLYNITKTMPWGAEDQDYPMTLRDKMK